MDNNVSLRTVRADLHNHLRTSSYVNRGSALFGSDLLRLARKARKNLGAGAVVGLIDFGDNRYEQTLASAYDIEHVETYNSSAALVPEYDVLVVHGQEVPTKQGHLLVLGTPKNRRIPSGLDFEETVKRARDLDGITIADHPFYRDGLGEYIMQDPIPRVNLLDGFEIHNGEAAFGYDFPIVRNIFPPAANSRAQEVFYGDEVGHVGIGYLNLSMAPLCTSDGHSFAEVGSSYTELLMPKSYEDILPNGNINSCLRRSLANAGLRSHKGWNSSDSKWGAARHAAYLATIIANGALASNLPSPLSAPFAYFDRKFHGTSKAVQIH